MTLRGSAGGKQNNECSGHIETMIQFDCTPFESGAFDAAYPFLPAKTVIMCKSRQAITLRVSTTICRSVGSLIGKGTPKAGKLA